jgi:hypothetical protein
MTYITAMTIKAQEVRCEAGGPDENGKFAGWIMLDVDRWRPLVSTSASYGSQEAAIEAMKQLVEHVRKIDLAAAVDSENDKIDPTASHGL